MYRHWGSVQAVRLVRRGVRGIALSFHDHGTRRGWGVSSLPPGQAQCPLYRRLDWPQGRSGQVRKISPRPGFDPRTAQPVASRYTDYATRPTYPVVFLICFVSAVIVLLASLDLMVQISLPYKGAGRDSVLYNLFLLSLRVSVVWTYRYCWQN